MMDRDGAIPQSDLSDEPRFAAGARCLRCSADLSRLPQWARFCPQCGLDALQGPPATLLEHAGEPQAPADGVAGWGHLWKLAPRSVSAAPSFAPRATPDSRMLSGYSQAMYNLARRYERGLGSARNPREAARCYNKAARLGNI